MPQQDTAHDHIAGLAPDIIAAKFGSVQEFRDWHPHYEYSPPRYNWQIVKCSLCTTLYVVTSYALNHSYFCSVDCRKRWYTREYDEDILDLLNTRNKSRAPERVKEQVREDADRSCAHCDLPEEIVRIITSDSRSLEVHHITKHSKFITPEAADHPANLTPLTPGCHNSADSVEDSLDAPLESATIDIDNRPLIKHPQEPPTPDELRAYKNTHQFPSTQSRDT